MVDFFGNLAKLSEILQPIGDIDTQRRNQQYLADVAATGGGRNFASNLANLQNAETSRMNALKAIGGATPSDVQTALWYHNASPEERRAFDITKRSQQLQNLGNQVVRIGPNGEVLSSYDVGVNPNNDPSLRGAQARAEAAGRLGQELQIRPQIEGAVLEAKNQAIGQAGLPKLTSSYEASVAKNAQLMENIKQAESQVNGLTAGYVGSKLSQVPGTKAADLQATLTTIKANLGFDELAQMRANAPTGGALGSVSENENKLLQSAVTNLENSQSPEQLKSNLEKLRKIKTEGQERIRKAYEADLKRFGSQAMQNVSQAMPEQLDINNLRLPPMPETEGGLATPGFNPNASQPVSYKDYFQ